MSTTQVPFTRLTNPSNTPNHDDEACALRTCDACTDAYRGIGRILAAR